MIRRARRAGRSELSSLLRWLWRRPWLLLGYMAFVSGANGVAARLATDEVPPFLLVFLRWFIVCSTLAVVMDGSARRELRALVVRHWPRLAWMGLLGYAGFNALFYTAAYHTSGINLTLLQSAIPALVLLGAALVFRQRIGALQVVGMLLTFFGVLLVAAKGDPARLAAFRLDTGDAGVLVACLFYAAYTLGLRGRPPATPLVFFAGVALAALAWSVPIAAEEIVTGQSSWPSAKGWLITAFIAFGPSFTGQLCFMRGVDLIGPARAGLAANLIPVFGAICAVLVLRETFTVAHAVALLLGLGGISLAEWSGRRLASDDGASAAPGDAPLP